MARLFNAIALAQSLIISIVFIIFIGESVNDDINSG